MSGVTNTLGGYQIVREIARSNDIVYEARDPALNRRVAVKELALTPNLVGQEKRERIERFYREARAAGALSHPNIVTIFKVGEDNGRHFIAMEYLEGDTLRTLLQVGGSLPLTRALEICAQVCDALDYAHQRGIVHRDVKPDNIQILPDGTAKLTDFGIARLGNEPGITQAGQVFGTPSYMSPEQIAGKPVDQRSDVFSLGVVLYEILTSRKPFTGDSIVTITYNIMNLEPAPPPGVPPHLQGIVRKAMAKSPDGRYASAADFARDLRSPAPALPAFNSNPFAQHTTSLPRVTSLPGSTGPLGVPGMGQPPSSGPPAPARPYGYATPAPVPMRPAGSPPGASLPALPSLPALGGPAGTIPLPPPTPRFGEGFREVVIKNSPFLTLLGLVGVLIVIALGVFWALKSGYEGYQNGEISDSQRAINNDAAKYLQQGNYEDAGPPLFKLIQQIRPANPLYKTVQHNLGTYWLEAARSAQQHGDQFTARNDYQQALPLLPERAPEIQQAIEGAQLGLSAPGGASSGPTLQPDPVQVDPSGAPAAAPSAGYPSPSTAPATPTSNAVGPAMSSAPAGPAPAPPASIPTPNRLASAPSTQ
ncbi:MAG: protein kinase, partial [Armatimonadota bacterium]|nr:protein kinase [Armatimonadota bacterium]